MWWLLAAAGIAALMSAASEDERRAAERFNRTQLQVRRDMQTHRSQISNHYGTANRNLRFKKLCDLHWESHKINQLASETYKDAKVSCSGMSGMICRAEEEREKLRKQIKTAEKKKDTREADRLGEKHRVIQSMLTELFEEKKVLQAQKNTFYEEMMALREKTGDLKLQIRDTCGEKGREWYCDLEMRTARRKLLTSSR
jgi:hypothetical protein